MTTVSEIKTAITQLTLEELRELRTWYEQFEADQWDAELEADVAAGRLDSLADEAIRDFQAGTATEL
ncbi:hypothetical protein [Candidatus Viridilinea mediisalina]|uniref:Uncharacterized protein n=1 Tax=Candidatus Viridilinea mediisalina TaxID=2024553 RepID=A0A2A6RPN8_9CHLR|nr:hypothetical protein [Candidatus Viridilinea mediisalina]PDW05084.1 hypothetical protein CJ255_00385 [Candidatus Viridilinea mediisalina]